MAIAFRSMASDNGDVNTSTAITITKPSGTVDDDLMVLFVCADNSDDDTPSPAFDLPGGWTTIFDQVETAGRGRGFALAYKKASSEGANYAITHNFTTPSTTEMNGVILSYSGVDTTTALDQTTPAADVTLNTTTPDPPSITTTTANAMVVCGCMTTGTVGSAYDPPAGYTERADVDFDHTGLAVAEFLNVGADAENPGTFTHTNGQSTDDSIAWTLALKAAAAAGATPHNPLGHPLYGPLRGPIS